MSGWKKRAWLIATLAGVVVAAFPGSLAGHSLADQLPFRSYLPVVSKLWNPAWLGQYFNGESLEGEPAVVRGDDNVDFDWGPASPAPGVPADGFSARWVRTLELTPGQYRFSTITDDGLRLWVDDSLVIDQWHDMGTTEYSAYQTLAAPTTTHRLRMEYYDAGGDARARLWWQNLTEFPERWRGEYFANKDLTGEPAVIIPNISDIDFDWGEGSAVPGHVPVDGFSARWTRTLSLPGGQYRACTYTDDGVRLWIDSQLVSDHWENMAATLNCADFAVSPGLHTMKMEYFDSLGGAIAKLFWFGSTSDFPQWRGEYYNKKEPAAADLPVFVRAESEINVDWGTGAPAPGVGPDNFFVRWTGLFYLTKGQYTFIATSDDGIRVSIDYGMGEIPIIDNWRVGPEQTRSISFELLASTYYKLRVEYFDDTSLAVARLRWERTGEVALAGADQGRSHSQPMPTPQPLMHQQVD